MEVGHAVAEHLVVELHGSERSVHGVRDLRHLVQEERAFVRSKQVQLRTQRRAEKNVYPR